MKKKFESCWLSLWAKCFEPKRISLSDYLVFRHEFRELVDENTSFKAIVITTKIVSENGMIA